MVSSIELNTDVVSSSLLPPRLAQDSAVNSNAHTRTIAPPLANVICKRKKATAVLQEMAKILATEQHELKYMVDALRDEVLGLKNEF